MQQRSFSGFTLISFPFSVWDAPWLSPVALAMDLVLGDPRLPWPHPVCLVGKLMNLLEKPCRKFMLGGSSHSAQTHRGTLAGFVALGACLGITGATALLLVSLPWVGTILAIYLAWSGLAMGCLQRTGRTVLEKVENENLSEARVGVSWLVSRDVSQLDRQHLRKTLADTLSENFTDAFMAPFLWLLLCGPVGLWLYKTVSTMDSQWGYLTPKWSALGFAGAKGDDMLAWPAARLAIVAIYITDWLGSICRFKVWSGSWPGFTAVAKDARGMPSPNSGWSMAACAWLCGARMAGPSVYFGSLVQKPWLGPPQEKAIPWDKNILTCLQKLMFYAAIIGGLGMWLLACALRWVV